MKNDGATGVLVVALVALVMCIFTIFFIKVTDAGKQFGRHLASYEKVMK